MNYRHAYHAGNFGDVVKHFVLTLVLEHLVLKPKPFRVIDVHAGVGLYDLDSEEALATGEWRNGIGRLIPGDERRAPPEAIERYLAIVRSFNESDNESGDISGVLTRYPGSPMIARRMMRTGDRLVANELHPGDYRLLHRLLSRDRQAKVLQLDAWTALKSLLPPRERRGVVLIDPPFEQQGEFERMLDGLTDALDRFANGIFMLWYPLKDPKRVERFHRRLGEACRQPALLVELAVRRPRHPERLNGAGLVVVNPPYTLEASLGAARAYLLEHLGQEPGSELRLEWLVREGEFGERERA